MEFFTYKMQGFRLRA